jgi:hypothetical protein
MTTSIDPCQRLGWAAVVVCLLLKGCGGGGGDSVDRYVPEVASARSSLETALNAWKGGAPLKTIEEGGHKIDVFDERWRSGQKLESYEILAEQKGDPHPQFLVKTVIKGKEEATTYLVMGIDPINIFREQEYKKTTGM